MKHYTLNEVYSRQSMLYDNHAQVLRHESAALNPSFEDTCWYFVSLSEICF